MTARPVGPVPDDLSGRLELVLRLLRLTVATDAIRSRPATPALRTVRERVECALEDMLEAKSALGRAPKEAGTHAP